MTTSILNSSKHVQSRIFFRLTHRSNFPHKLCFARESIRLLHRNNSYGVPSRFTQFWVLNSRDTFWLPERVVSRMHHVRGFRGRSHVGAPGLRLHEETTRLARNDYRRFLLIIRSNETIFLPRPCRRILAKLPSLRSPSSPGRIQFHSSYLEYSTIHTCMHTHTDSRRTYIYKYPNAT